MAKAKSFRCQLITPEQAMLDADAHVAVITAHDGEMGILPGRAPLLCKLGIGEVRVTTADDKVHFYVDGGFAHMMSNELVVLTERALPVAEINIRETEKELNALREQKVIGREAVDSRARDMKRAMTKLKLAGRR